MVKPALKNEKEEDRRTTLCVLYLAVDAKPILARLRKSEFNMRADLAFTVEEYIAKLRYNTYDIVLRVTNCLAGQGMDALERLQRGAKDRSRAR